VQEPFPPPITETKAHACLKEMEDGEKKLKRKPIWDKKKKKQHILEEFCIHKITMISCSITIKYKLQMSLNDPLFRLVNTLPCGSDDRLQHINGI